MSNLELKTEKRELVETEDVLEESKAVEAVSTNMAIKDTMALELMTEQLLDTSVAFGVPESIIQNIDKDEVERLQKLSQALEVPLSALSESGDTAAEEVIASLTNLRDKVTEILPANNNLEETFISGLIAKITGNTAVKKYLNKFKTVNSVIEEISAKLNQGGVRLRELNTIYLVDKERYRATSLSIANKVKILEALEVRVQNKMNELTSEEDAANKDFLETEVLYPLTAKIQDSHQLLAVAAQGVLSLDILIKNNKELINSTKRTQTLTVAALRIGALVAAGLAEEGKTLDAINRTNKVTGDILESNGKMLKERGADIHKRASSAMINMDQMTNALTDTLAAINDIEKYKREAIPQMRETASKLRVMNNSIERNIKKIEVGEKVAIPTAY